MALLLALYTLLLLLLVPYVLDYGARRARADEEPLLRRCPSLEEALSEWGWEQRPPPPGDDEEEEEAAAAAASRHGPGPVLAPARRSEGKADEPMGPGCGTPGPAIRRSATAKLS